MTKAFDNNIPTHSLSPYFVSAVTSRLDVDADNYPKIDTGSDGNGDEDEDAWAKEEVEQDDISKEKFSQHTKVEILVASVSGR